jgi:uncharacterized protein YvpB
MSLDTLVSKPSSIATTNLRSYHKPTYTKIKKNKANQNNIAHHNIENHKKNWLTAHGVVAYPTNPPTLATFMTHVSRALDLDPSLMVDHDPIISKVPIFHKRHHNTFLHTSIR